MRQIAGCPRFGLPQKHSLCLMLETGAVRKFLLPQFYIKKKRDWRVCICREQSLRSAGFTDIFAAVKEEESRKALQLLPSVIR